MTEVCSARVLMFDLDDTLVDDGQATASAAKALFQHYQPQQEAAALTHWQRALKKYYPDFLQAKISASEMRQARAREALQMPQLSDAEAEQAFEYFMQQYIAATQLYAESLACLAQLRQQGWRLALVSNGPEDMQQRKVTAAGLNPYFEFVLTAEAAGAAKPKAAIFQQAAQRAQVSLSQCCYIGDNLANDAQGAAAAGMQSIWLKRDGLAAQVQPYQGVAWQISSLTQLIHCIELDKG
ncbi:HAD family hydrolase [Agarivorans gilvus]|uniref:Hydrolase n=1 Tax=Agarivorans gilvus TaxID=680279 RepID=A0ABQ1I0I2_9ALTE|nr:HAD family hydrolase [Agarivorans gilvus]GGB04864.1 hydrolase [Agarivorans gilvus]